MARKAFASSADLAPKEQKLEVLADGVYALHPGGHSHGPQPGADERSIGAEFFDEFAVMVDTFRPLALGEAGQAGEDPGYAWTWAA
jgi:homogentisate 1,2-dioxygenase